MSVSAVATTVQHQVATQSGSSRTSSVIKHAAIGGVIGAAGAAALSMTALPFIGALSAPIAAAIGGAAGIVVGGIIGFLKGRSGGDDAHVAVASVGQQQTPPAPGTTSTGLPPALPS